MVGIYIWSVFITSVFFVSFGLFSYLKDRKELPNKLFGLFSLSFAIWAFGWFSMLLIKENRDVAVFWGRFLNFGAILIPIFYLHWVLALLGQSKKKKLFLIFCYTITFLFVATSFTPFFIKGVHSIFSFPFWPTAGFLYKWFLIFDFFPIIAYGFFSLVKEFRPSTGEKKYQIGYIIIGSLFGFIGGATNFSAMYDLEFFGSISVFAGIYAVMVCPFILSYAVIKYNLMNVRVIATEFFVGVINLILLINFFTSETVADWFIRGLILVLVSIFSVLLIRSVLQEVKTRQKLEILAKNLEVANIELQRLDKAKTEFLNIASHQLRTPVSVIKGVASMMKEGDLDRMPEEKRKNFIRGVWEKSQKLEEIINDILNASEMTSVEYQLNKDKAEFFDVTELMKKIIEGFEPLAKEREIELIFEPSGEAVPKIYGQKDYLEEALGNLINNAIKYTPSAKKDSEARDSRLQKGRVVVGIKKDGEGVIIEVRDNGIGVPALEVPELFKKFARASNAKDMYTDGSGLGLYIAKEIIEGHGGSIRLESQQNRGATFFVSLPSWSGKETDIKKYIIEKQNA